MLISVDICLFSYDTESQESYISKQNTLSNLKEIQ